MPAFAPALRRLKKPAPFPKDAGAHVNALRFSALARGAQADPERAAKALQAAPFLYAWLRNFCVSPAAAGAARPSADVCVFAKGYGGPLARALAAATGFGGGDGALPAGWIEAEDDAPGAALPTAVGVAVARESAGGCDPAAKTWCVVGQDELGGGAFYEAAQLAGARSARNLVCLADCSGVDAGGFFSEHGAPDLPGLMRALGWEVFRANDATDLDLVNKALMRAATCAGPAFVALGTVAAHGTAAAGTYLAHRPPEAAMAPADLAERFGAQPLAALPEALVKDVSAQMARRAAERADYAARQRPLAAPAQAEPRPPAFAAAANPADALAQSGARLLLAAPHLPPERRLPPPGEIVNACGMRAAHPWLWRGLAAGGAGAFACVLDAACLPSLADAWRFRRPPALFFLCVDDAFSLSRFAFSLPPLREAGFRVRFAADAASLSAHWREHAEEEAPVIAFIPPGRLPPAPPQEARREDSDPAFCVRTMGYSAQQSAELAAALDKAGERYSLSAAPDPDAFASPGRAPTFCVGVCPWGFDRGERPAGNMPLLVKSARLTPAQTAQAILDLRAARADKDGERN